MARAVLISILAACMMAMAVAQGSDDGLAITPVLECVQSNQDGTYIAYWGYYNPFSAPVFVPIGMSAKLID